jgi:acyl-CoA reductase-like NAD-dependent aldehyde dehydrogenase
MVKFEIPSAPITYKILIDGNWKESESNETFSRQSPGHGVPVGVYQKCNEADTIAAIRSAKKTILI